MLISFYHIINVVSTKIYEILKYIFDYAIIVKDKPNRGI